MEVFFSKMRCKWAPARYMSLEARHDYLEECFWFISRQVQSGFPKLLMQMFTNAVKKLAVANEHEQDDKERIATYKGTDHSPMTETEFHLRCVTYFDKQMEGGFTRVALRHDKDVEVDYVEAREKQKAMDAATASHMPRGSEIMSPMWGDLTSDTARAITDKKVKSLEKKLKLEAPWDEDSDVYRAAFDKMVGKNIGLVREEIEQDISRIDELTKFKKDIRGGGTGGKKAEGVQRQITHKRKHVLKLASQVSMWERYENESSVPHAPEDVMKWTFLQTHPPWMTSVPDGSTELTEEDMRRYIRTKNEILRSREEIDLLNIEKERALGYYSYILSALERALGDLARSRDRLMDNSLTMCTSDLSVQLDLVDRKYYRYKMHRDRLMSLKKSAEETWTFITPLKKQG